MSSGSPVANAKRICVKKSLPVDVPRTVPSLRGVADPEAISGRVCFTSLAMTSSFCFNPPSAAAIKSFTYFSDNFVCTFGGVWAKIWENWVLSPTIWSCKPKMEANAGAVRTKLNTTIRAICLMLNGRNGFFLTKLSFCGLMLTTILLFWLTLAKSPKDPALSAAF